jgi:hypothetical protein
MLLIAHRRTILLLTRRRTALWPSPTSLDPWIGAAMARRELDHRSVARVIGAFGFDAVRGRSGSGSGAAPAHRLAGMQLEGVDDDKRTVARKAARGVPAGSPPPSTATPFDFAMAALFDWSRNGGRAGFEAALDLMAVLVVSLEPEELPGVIASLLRITIQDQFDSSDPQFLTGFGVQALALEYIRESGFRRSADPAAGERTDEPLAWARWLMDQRRQEARQTAEVYETVLSLCLLVMRRRPRPGYTIARIVRAAQSLWIGGVHRAFLDPDEYPEYGRGAPRSPVSPSTGLPAGDGQIELAIVDLIMGTTEESLFSANQTTLGSRLIAEGLRRYRTAESTVTVASLSDGAGVDAALVRALFPTDQTFASGCLRWLAGEWDGFDSFAREFRAAAAAGAEALLEWVGGVRRDFPALLASAGFAPGDPAFDEVVSFVSVVVAREPHGVNGVVSPADVKRARRCVEAAAGGGDWRAVADLPLRTRTGRRPSAPAT